MLKRLLGTLISVFAASAMAGIETSDKVDAIASRPDSPYVILLMTTTLAWDERTSTLLDKKLAHYIHFVKSGQLFEGRPTVTGKKVRVILAHESSPPESFVTKLTELRSKAELEGLQFVWGDRASLVQLAGAP